MVEESTLEQQSVAVAPSEVGCDTINMTFILIR